jgi:hypothetical protein
MVTQVKSVKHLQLVLTSWRYPIWLSYMSRRDPNKEMIGLWVRKELKGEITNRALDQNRTVSNYIETLLMKHINQDISKGETNTVTPQK